MQSKRLCVGQWVIIVLLVGSFSADSAVAVFDSDAKSLNGTWVGIYGPGSTARHFIVVRMEGAPTAPQIAVTARHGRFRGAAARNIGVDADRLSFDLDPQTRDWHFDLVSNAGRLEGHLEDRGDNSRFNLQLKRAVKLERSDFQPFVGDYRAANGDIFFVGYSESNRGQSLAFYVTKGDNWMQIFPVEKGRFLADSGAELSFDGSANGRATRLLWQGDHKTPRVADRVELWREEEVSFHGQGASLSGSLYLPAVAGPHPALVFVHGSGPEARFPNWPMADRFARAGIACLSYDKRGTGKSTVDWQQAGFDVLADDVLAGVELLRSRPDIRPDQIGLWGVSQAGWVIPLAASKSEHVAFCIAVSGAGVCPADQELWRRSEYLKHFGCTRVLLDAMRRGVAMHYQWEELFKGGRFPVVPFFEVEAINMYHDAAAVIRQVHQPVLAIFGEYDHLTPPRQSAAIWARELKAAGNRDYSVRMFPRATHGLLESDRTGSPFEVMPESRLAAGYLKTMIDWIKDHTGGKGAPEIRVDVSPEDVIESRGMRELPWYGSAPVQVPLLLACTLGSLLTIIGWPAVWAARRIRKLSPGNQARPRAIAMGWVVQLVALAMCVTTVAILRFLGDALPSDYYGWAEIGLWIVAALTMVIGWFAVLLIRAACRENGEKQPSPWDRAFYWTTAVTACLWIPFFVYWTWGPLLARSLSS
jgi:pimeloyl-ACP methyl ester carboxylesterase